MPRKTLVVLVTFLLIALAVVPAVHAVSATTMYIMLYVDKQEAFINDEKVPLDAPPTIIDGRTFVPLKFLGDTMGIEVNWNEETRKIEMVTDKFNIQLDSANNSVFVNGVYVPFDSVARIINGKLLVRTTWLSDYMGAKYIYNDELKRIEVIYVKQPQGISLEADVSKPVAKFTTNKKRYMMGEPVKYIDLSYDPDAEGIANYEWTGKEEVFFAPGKHPVTLRVTDSNGHVSDVYTRYVEVSEVTYLTRMEYAIHYNPLNSFIPTDWTSLYSNFLNLPVLPKETVYDESRTLLVSDSPETFKEKGILYQDKVNGKARLYADHINGMDETVQFAILATNRTKEPVTITTTNKGEVYPSIYANVIGHEASVDFLLNDVRSDKLIIPPGQTRAYAQMPHFFPGQGVNVFYDVETNGEVTFSFLAMDLISTPVSTYNYKSLPFDGHVRGTFPVSEIHWNVDISTLDKPAKLSIGDNETDVFVTGYDTFRKETVQNEGNYGIVYNIHMKQPPKMAVMILPRGGNFKGPIKFNGEFVMVPPSGILTAFDGLQILHRTTGFEDELNIEFTPPAGSAFPIDLIFYPLID